MKYVCRTHATSLLALYHVVKRTFPTAMSRSRTAAAAPPAAQRHSKRAAEMPAAAPSASGPAASKRARGSASKGCRRSAADRGSDAEWQHEEEDEAAADAAEDDVSGDGDAQPASKTVSKPRAKATVPMPAPSAANKRKIAAESQPSKKSASKKAAANTAADALRSDDDSNGEAAAACRLAEAAQSGRASSIHVLMAVATSFLTRVAGMANLSCRGLLRAQPRKLPSRVPPSQLLPSQVPQNPLPPSQLPPCQMPPSQPPPLSQLPPSQLRSPQAHRLHPLCPLRASLEIGSCKRRCCAQCAAVSSSIGLARSATVAISAMWRSAGRNDNARFGCKLCGIHLCSPECYNAHVFDGVELSGSCNALFLDVSKFKEKKTSEKKAHRKKPPPKSAGRPTRGAAHG